MVPASFAAIVLGGVITVGGQVAGLDQWPRYVAALLGFGAAALSRGNMLVTLGFGMACLHGLLWLVDLAS